MAVVLCVVMGKCLYFEVDFRSLKVRQKFKTDARLDRELPRLSMLVWIMEGMGASATEER